ncbi:MAG: PSD1 and planctomycete cytochrome C domain-containing protein [Gemmataceae bacterium]|nr:PSD1 and planctomycete cytochrome C domain-containing protein [Gemmataceae bacterium]
MIILAAVLMIADPAAEFDRAVAPIVQKHCAKCHTGDKLRAGLDLGSAAKTIRGAKSGPILVAGNGEGSLLVQVLTAGHDTHMPPTGQLTDDEIGTIRKWVDLLPKESVGKRKELEVTDRDRDHWAFRPLTSTAPSGPGHPIDAFIDAKLKSAGLTRAQGADPTALVRRLTFGLTGLPPTPEDSDQFRKDFARDPADAVARAADRLLASTAYGERWARHWLDVARYTDTEPEPMRGESAGAHLYRDYVIRSLNADKPYAKFLAEQIAGDLLPEAGRDGIIATAFLRLNPTSAGDAAKTRADELDDMVATTSSVALGLTVACARCHDHKTDPIPQRDYYRLAAAFAATQRRNVPVPTEEEKAAFEAAAATRRTEREKLESQLAEMEKDQRDRRDDFDRPDDDFVGPPSPSAWWRNRQAERQRIQTRIQALDAEQARAAATLAVAEQSDAPKSFMLLRGDARRPGDEVAPGLPIVLTRSPDLPTQSRRLALAKWLTEPLHPLTARVIVNRVWHHHFGRGLVDTPSNFGPAGGKPTHPELLDWLADEFIKSGGSLKKLHRLIVTSATYQQSSSVDKNVIEKDPANLLWSRFPRRRLEAEAIRDALLLTSGRLSPVMYGPGARARPSDGSLAPEAARSPLAVREGPQQWRRSVYLSVSRAVPSVMLESFDQPPPACPCDVRSSTTVAPQALLLLNAPFLLEQTEHLARRVKKEAGNDPAQQVDRLYRIALSRPPKPVELELALKFLDDPAVKIRPGRRPGSDDPGALADLAHVVCNLNEFIWLD